MELPSCITSLGDLLIQGYIGARAREIFITPTRSKKSTPILIDHVYSQDYGSSQIEQ